DASTSRMSDKLAASACAIALARDDNVLIETISGDLEAEGEKPQGPQRPTFKMRRWGTRKNYNASRYEVEGAAIRLRFSAFIFSLPCCFMRVSRAERKDSKVMVRRASRSCC